MENSGTAFKPGRIRLRQPGKLAKTTYVNEVAAKLNSQSPPYVSGGVEVDRVPPFIFPGKVVSAGPAGEADYGAADPRYWVEPQRIVPGGNSLTPDHSLTPQTIITAINFYGEQPAVPNAFLTPDTTSFHVLPIGTLVEVKAEADANGTVYYTINQARPPAHYFVRLAPDSGGGGGSNTTPDWTYTAYNIYGGTVATGQTPWNNRVIGYHVAAKNGIYVNGPGTNKGVVALDEIADAEACTPP